MSFLTWSRGLTHWGYQHWSDTIKEAFFPRVQLFLNSWPRFRYFRLFHGVKNKYKVITKIAAVRIWTRAVWYLAATTLPTVTQPLTLMITKLECPPPKKKIMTSAPPELLTRVNKHNRRWNNSYFVFLLWHENVNLKNFMDQ